MRQLLLLVTYVLFLLPSQAKDDYSMRWDASLAKSRYRSITMNDGLAANAVRMALCGSAPTTAFAVTTGYRCSSSALPIWA